MRLRLGILLALALVAQAAPAHALGFSDDGFDVRQLAMDLTLPTAAAVAPDGRVFVVEKRGRLLVAEPGDPRARLIWDLSARVNSYGDRGLLGLALDTDFEANRRLYLLYVGSATGRDESAWETSRLVYVEVAADSSVGAENIVLDGIPAEDWFHTIGTIRSAADGTLWLGTGDATVYANERALEALDPDYLRGKILHVDREGRGLETNPFWNGDATSTPSKVFAGGFRNPFRFHLRQGGGLVVGDVGNSLFEELSLVDAGELHGWPCFEAMTETTISPYHESARCTAWRNPLTRPPTAAFPDLHYPREHGAAIVAGPEYAGDGFPAEYHGSVFFGDYARGTIRRRLPDASVRDFATGWVGVQLDPTADGDDLVSVEIGDGRPATGAVNLITWSPGDRTPTARVSVTPAAGVEPFTATFSAAQSADPDGDPLTFTWDFGDGSPEVTSAETEAQHTYTEPGRYVARVRVDDDRGRTAWETVVVPVGNPPALTLTGDDTFRPGRPVSVHASAVDREDGRLPASALSWDVVLYHDDHLHAYTSGTGSAIEFTPDEAHAENGQYEVRVTAADSHGLETSVSRRLALGPPPAAPALPDAPLPEQPAQEPFATPAAARDRKGPVLKVAKRGRILAGTVRDASPPVKVRARLNGKGRRWRNARVGGTRWRIVLHGARRGRHRVKLRATDAAGNTTRRQIRVRIRRR